MGLSLGPAPAATPDLDSGGPGYEVTRGDTDIVVEVSRLLRTRASEQGQAKTQWWTLVVAVVAVLITVVQLALAIVGCE